MHAGGASQGGNHPSGGDFTNGVIVGVGHIDRPVGVHREPVRVVKLGRCPSAVVGPRNTGGARQGGYDPSGGDLAEGMVIRVHHVKIASAIGRRFSRKVELRPTARPVGGTRTAGQPGHRSHPARRQDFAQGLVPRIGHIHVSRAIHGHATGRAEQGDTVGAISGTGSQAGEGGESVVFIDALGVSDPTNSGGHKRGQPYTTR